MPYYIYIKHTIGISRSYFFKAESWVILWAVASPASVMPHSNLSCCTQLLKQRKGAREREHACELRCDLLLLPSHTTSGDCLHSPSAPIRWTLWQTGRYDSCRGRTATDRNKYLCRILPRANSTWNCAVPSCPLLPPILCQKHRVREGKPNNYLLQIWSWQL